MERPDARELEPPSCMDFFGGAFLFSRRRFFSYPGAFNFARQRLFSKTCRNHTFQLFGSEIDFPAQKVPPH